MKVYMYSLLYKVIYNNMRGVMTDERYQFAINLREHRSGPVRDIRASKGATTAVSS